MNKLDVFYGNEPVGTLAIVRGGIYFEYAAEFVAKRVDTGSDRWRHDASVLAASSARTRARSASRSRRILSPAT